MYNYTLEDVLLTFKFIIIDIIGNKMSTETRKPLIDKLTKEHEVGIDKLKLEYESLVLRSNHVIVEEEKIRKWVNKIYEEINFGMKLY